MFRLAVARTNHRSNSRSPSLTSRSHRRVSTTTWRSFSVTIAALSPCPGLLARQLVGAVPLVAALPILTGCQQTLDVSVANRCERTVETNVDSFENSETKIDLQWVRIAPGAREDVAQ